MRIKGKIRSLTPKFFPKHSVEILLETDEDVMQDLTQIMLSDVSIELKKWSDKRTLTANSYYWELLGQLARKLKLSNAELHNRMLRDYGQYMLIANRPIRVEIPDTDEAEKQVMLDSVTHLYPTSQTVEHPDGTYRVYLMLKGSSKMDKEEFGYLLENLIDECKDQGITTETPDEIARLMALWNQS